MAGGVSLGNAYGQVIIDGAGAVTGIGGVQRGLLDLQGGFLGVNPLTVAFGIGLTGVAVAAGGMAAAIGTGVDKASDLQSQLSGVQALTGASAEEMDALRGTIDELSLDPDLKVSAFQAADALEKLASNGVGVQDIVNGAARSTVLLANAMGTDDFAGAATTATDVMALFGFRADQMEQAVNGITAVVNESKFEFGDYQLALAQAGGVASAVGVNFDDFNTTIAGISSLFASGSDAGTSFKTFLQRLIPTSDDAAAEMKKLGIITEDGQNQFFDTNGQLKDMADISGILQGALAGLSDEQRNNALSTIFGTDAMRAAVGLANLGSDGFERLQTTMGQTSAADAAATRMNNLKGVLEILGGVIEAVQLRVGDEFIPLFTSLAKKATEFVSGNADQIVAFFGGIADGAAAGADAIERFVAGFSQGFAAGGGGFEGFLQGIETGLAGLVSPETMAGIQQAIQLIRELGTAGGTMGAEIQAAFAEGGLSGVIDLLMTKLGEAWPTIQATLATWGTQFWDWLVGPGGAIEQGGDKLGQLIQWIADWINQNPTLFQGAGKNLGAALLVGIGAATEEQEKVDEVAGKLAAALAKAVGAIAGALGEIGASAAGEILKGLIEKLTGAEATGQVAGAIQGAASGLVGAFNPLGQLNNLIGSLGDNLPTPFTPGSPTPFEMGLRGIADAASQIPDLGSIFGGLPNTANLAALAAPGAAAAGGGGSSTTTLTIGDIIIQGAQDPKATAAEVRRVLAGMFNKAAVGAVG